MNDAHGRFSKRTRPKLSVVAVYAYCPDCGIKRRVWVTDPGATELTVRCGCVVAPLLGHGVTSTFEVSAHPDLVGKKGGLCPWSVNDYVGALARWDDALRLQRQLCQLTAVSQQTSNDSGSKRPSAIAEVLASMPATALSPGVEEWIAVASTVVLSCRACDNVAEKQTRA